MTDSAAEHGLCWKQIATGVRDDRELLASSVRKEDAKMDP